MVYPVLTNEEVTTESQGYNCFTRNAGNAIPKHAGPEAKGSNPKTGRTMLWARTPFRGNFNHWQVSRKETGHTLFPNWQKESWQSFEETSGYVRPERVNKWPNSMTDMMKMMMMMTMIMIMMMMFGLWERRLDRSVRRPRKRFFMDCLTLGYGGDRLYRNVGNKVPTKLYIVHSPTNALFLTYKSLIFTLKYT